MLRKKFIASEIEEIRKQWDMRKAKLSLLAKQKVIETRAEEIFRLDQAINQEEDERKKLEQEMLQLEAQLEEINREKEERQKQPEQEPPQPNTPVQPSSRINIGFDSKTKLLSVSLVCITVLLMLAIYRYPFFADPAIDNESKTVPEFESPTATHRQLPENMTDPVTGMEFVSIPGGSFQMGSPPDEEGRDDDEGPVHKVRVDGFWMGKYEVTQGQWMKIMGDNPSEFQKGDNYPVETVSWNKIQEFINKLNKKSGKNYRLPTEAEWEYACRAGGSGKYCGGNNLDSLAWYSKNSKKSTHPVGGKQANAFDLHDMSGNVWEWCADWYDEKYYASGSEDNPTGPSSGSERVLRGGGWNFTSKNVRATARYRVRPGYRDDYLGFRLVLSAQQNHIFPKAAPQSDVDSKMESQPSTGSHKSMTDPVTGMEFVSVSGGSFQMGSPDDEEGRDADEGPVHKVRVHDFRIGKYEVTQGQWVKIMGRNPAEFQKGDNYPVEKVSWNDIQEFIAQLNKKSGKTYRLPTEAEWEYACRAGGSGKYCGGDNMDSLAWYSNNSSDSTHPVGGKQANGFGLYDMSGNVWEWCADWSGEDYYSSSPQNNPTGPSSGSYRVIRGGSLNHLPKIMRAANRGVAATDNRNNDLGFRLVLSLQ